MLYFVWVMPVVLIICVIIFCKYWQYLFELDRPKFEQISSSRSKRITHSFVNHFTVVLPETKEGVNTSLLNGKSII